MSEDAVSRLFIQRFVNNFGAPMAPDPESFFAEYQRALGGTDDDILREAAAHVVDHHGFPQRWPTVAECKSAVEHIAAERTMAQQRRNWGKRQGDEKWTEPSAEAKARVAVLMRETIARLRKMGTIQVNVPALPDVSRPAWEARFGKNAARPRPRAEHTLLANGLPDVSQTAWEARFGKPPPKQRVGYKAGEVGKDWPQEE